MTFKLVGICAILCAGVLLRSVMCERRRERLILCEELHRFLLHIRTRISCYLEPPSRLHLGFESKPLFECGFIERLEKGEDISKGLELSGASAILTEEQLICAKEVFSSIGTGYLEEQIGLLDGGIKSFFSLVEKERESLPRDIKLINTLTVSFSVGIAILLI